MTTFTAGGGEQTIPIWILQNYSRTSGLPIVNAVALILILLSVIPVYFAQRLAGAEAGAAAAAEPRPRLSGDAAHHAPAERAQQRLSAARIEGGAQARSEDDEQGQDDDRDGEQHGRRANDVGGTGDGR